MHHFLDFAQMAAGIVMDKIKNLLCCIANNIISHNLSSHHAND
jgi:hypothetical protein